MISNADSNQSTGRVLVVDDHRQARESMTDVLQQAGYDLESCSSAAEALRILDDRAFDCIVTDLMMPGMSGLEFIRQLQQQGNSAQVVMVTAHATVASAVEAIRHGAFDYIEKPFDVDQLETLVGQAIRHGQLFNGHPGGEEGSAAQRPVAMIGSSTAMESLRGRIAQIAPTSETVLILGESGTGKELVARAIHAASRRSAGPLVSLNCPVLSAQLMESELFGHERGAFTGAEASRVGRFEMADGGSILLDEVTEIAPPLQAKLLRVLQERCFERVGSSQTVGVDVRVLATTNRDLRTAVSEGEFREDLYFRLAVVPLNVPPLRDRAEDIPELADHFLRLTAGRLQRQPCTLETSAWELLTHYDWPGNVRELENIITRASVLADGSTITADALRRWLMDCRPTDGTPADSEVPVGLSLEEMERKLIQGTLEHFDGHRAKTASALGIGVRTLSGKLRQYGYAPRAKRLAKAG